MSENYVIIFDTTLRDGEQSPGASLEVQEKLMLAMQLARLNVDVIEAGFPISSPAQFDAVKLIAQEVKGPVIAGLARSLALDIDRCWEAVRFAKKPRIHTFIATSQVHVKHKLRKSEDEILEMAVAAVKRAKGYCEDVEFSPEDSSRTGKDFLFRIIEAVIDAGATVINIPDTVGYSNPEEFGNLIREIREKVPNIDQAILSVHCHNDLGMAVANSLSAIRNGAQQVECTINGIGERAGNASLEEIVMALKTRKDFYGKETRIRTEEIMKTSRMVSHLTGIVVQPNKAIVGANAFAHESGIHQDAVLKDARTYEIMTPQSIGLATNKIVLGRHSGRHGLKKRLEDLGYKLSAEELDKIYQRFMELADKKKEIFDEDLAVIVEDITREIKEVYHLEYFHVFSGNNTIPTATVGIKVNEKLLHEAACGDGPVDAAYKAIDKIVQLPVKLEDYTLRAVTSGKDALGEVGVTVAKDDKRVYGRGTSTDVLEASIKAYLNALNRLTTMINQKGK
ncbi:2-isopropylmalate synthase [candidate division KSB1 bacterium]|nr:MAG: 2-isopropylmalate synthase [candidate division KSB1 bacterium]RKY79422.1 MAG: 2-isopropylmalate synthase [candidate division KSB1 bacterium]RKY83247.1 MAG: 2-isopropylmalate synthase [candidate division KSB1 bacterium]RKY85438.1 MAG: 2-isopropylmalate synthase [candidate division KSB1 bacterium]RKY92879.1 MAG: 2-isopropylmalate synthase [candidate division KSB1 bacterium]